MNKLFISSIFIVCGFVLLSYDLPPAKYEIIHYNITFAPDLSNRVNPAKYSRPLQDVTILHKLTENLYPSILRERRSEQQKDKFRVDFINKGLIPKYQVRTQRLFLDFGRFGTRQIDRINYIRGKNHSPDTLQHDLVRLNNEFSRVYAAAKAENFGADIWTYLSEIDEQRSLRPDKAIPDGTGNTYNHKYRNVLILTTDGYIEAGIYGKGFDLSKKRIDEFRKAFINSGETDLQSFFRKRSEYRINPTLNPNLKNIEVLVMELFDRSRSIDGAATVHPTDLDIMKLFWTDWLKQSGVKRFELHPCASSKEEAEKIILNFLGVTKKADPILVKQ